MFALAVLAISPALVHAEACIISDVSVSTPSSSVTTGTNIVFTSTSTANSTCTASTIQLVSEGQSTGSSLTISDPGSPYYYSNAQVSSSGTTKTFTATAGVADTYNYYVQTTFQTSPSSKSSATGVLRVISPSTLTVSGTPTTTQTKASGASFTMTATATNPTNTSVSTSYNLSYSAANFTVTGDATSGTLAIGAGSSSTLSWTVTLAATMTSAGDNLTLQLGDNTNAFRVTANSTSTTTPTPAPSYPSSFGSSGSLDQAPALPPAATATPAPAATPTPAPTPVPEIKQLGSNSLVTGSIGGTSSTFQLSYTAGSGGFQGTLTYTLPFDYQDYLDGIITFDPKPSLVRRGSVVAEYRGVSLVESETHKLTVTVAKALESSVLQQFTAPKAVAATPTPAPVVTEAPTAAPEAPTPAPTAAGDMNNWLIGGVLLVIIVGALYLYLARKNA
ncbi:MAG: hypothetical protein WC792_05345 [Candidatus Micrarchaeia archaeon]